MQKSEGVAVLVTPFQAGLSSKTFKCNHCDGIRPMLVCTPAGVQEDGYHWCDVCDARVCNKCIKEKRDHRCIPWERKMEMMEAKGRFLSDVAILSKL